MISFCLNCGSFYKVRFLFCRTCLSKLEAITDVNISLAFENAYVVSQFAWTETNTSCLLPAIRALKKLRTAHKAHYFALNIENWFNGLPSHFLTGKKELLWVPVPSPSNPIRTVALAQYFSSILGGRLYDVLEVKDYSPQKKKTLKERNKVLIRVKYPDPHFNHDSKVLILVDDIVTTGATLRSCQKALKMDYLIAWTFAYRTKAS